MTVLLAVVAAGCGQGGGVSGSAGSTRPGAPSAVAESGAPPPVGTASPNVTSASIAATPSGPVASPTVSGKPFVLTSPAFQDGGAIPRDVTCDGADRSPALSWNGAPAGTAALVLVVDDPDAGGFAHWLVVDLPGASSGSLPAAVAPDASSPQQGRNDFGRIGWAGPCPPSRTHHYRFVLTALASPLGLTGHPDKGAVEAALRRAKVLRQATLGGTYRRA